MRIISGALVLALFFILPQALESQSRLSLEVRGGANFPVGEFADEEGGVEAESNLSFGVDAIYRFAERFSFFGGFSRSMYDCGVCGTDDDLNTMGAEAGLMVQFFERFPWLQPWVRVGAIYHRLELDIYAPTIADESVESDWNFGFQFAGGFDIPVTDYLSFTPMARVQTYSVDMPDITNPTDPNPEDPVNNLQVGPSISHFSLEIGGRLHIPAFQ